MTAFVFRTLFLHDPHIFATPSTFPVCFEDHYPVIMSTAKAKGIVGDEYFWFFSPGISGNVLQVNAVYEPGSVLYEATRGVGLIQLEASLTTTQMRSNEDADTALPEVPENGHERFRVAWREAMEDIILVEYFRSKLPPSLESIDGFGRSEPFSKEPSVFGAFAYDAVTALGIAMCNVELDFISGPEIYDKLVNVAFDGASGKVVLNGKTGTRDYTTLSYMMWNFFPRHGMAGFELVPTNYYKNGEWQPIPNGKSFCYADGTSTPPENLPPIDENMNMIGSIARTISYILIGVIVFCSCCAILWVICCRNEPVVRASQPLFLYMVALGSLIMAVSIIPLSLEEPVSIEILNMACIAHFWIYLTGYLLAFTAFFAKARRIKQVR
jgi:7 transmembrane sweet-taste receptor of 3 GCPR/Receptor family ligand binding region